jgi:hypothetical protein
MDGGTLLDHQQAQALARDPRLVALCIDTKRKCT